MWERELGAAGRAATAAAKILMDRFGHVSEISKKGEIDLVTEADLMAERSILEIISRDFPGDGILSEEAGVKEEGSHRIWIIDPLDGTTNFVHGFPFFGVSLALESEGKPVLGIVYNPFLDEYFEAVRGAGAFLNKKRIQVSSTIDISACLLATGFPYDIHENPTKIMEIFSRMITRAQGLRRPGSAALDLCYVAAGKFDGFWEQGLKPWDTAAGKLIVEEAGGKVTTFEGTTYTPFNNTIIASNGHIHDALVRIVNDS